MIAVEWRPGTVVLYLDRKVRKPTEVSVPARDITRVREDLRGSSCDVRRLEAPVHEQVLGARAPGEQEHTKAITGRKSAWISSHRAGRTSL